MNRDAGPRDLRLPPILSMNSAVRVGPPELDGSVIRRYVRISFLWEWRMSLDQLAREIAESLARHRSRGLVDDANGMADVVIHGHIDLVGVASDVLLASITHLKPIRKSWSGWFTSQADARRRVCRYGREVEKLTERMLQADNVAEAAIIRLKSRKIRP